MIRSKSSCYVLAAYAAVLPLAIGSAVAADTPPAAQPQLAVRYRKPVAAALSAGNRHLLVANRRSGTVSLLDTADNRISGEFPVSDRLSALARSGDGLRFTALDDKRNELVLLRLVASSPQPSVEVVARSPVAADPAGVALSADARLAAVACRWSHRLQLVEIDSPADQRPPSLSEPRLSWPEPKPRLVADIRLPFAPREVLFVDDERRLIVADAFGGSLAVVDLQVGGRVRLFSVVGQSIRGLAYDAERREIVFAYQHLDENLPTTPEAIAEGRLLANRLRFTGLRELPHDDSADVRPWPGHDQALDRPGRAAADPQHLALAPDGTLLLALGGSNQLAVAERALASRTDSVRRRVGVGLRPSSVAFAGPRRRAYVVNQLSDSISVVHFDSAAGAAETTVPLGPSPDLYPRDRGERLFFDARLSPGGFLSCHSCHIDGHTSGKLADTLADGTYGTPKRILTLHGTSLTDFWAWNAEIRELREQVRRSLETTMHVPPMRAADHDDVAAFLHTLPFPQPAEPRPPLPTVGTPITPEVAADLEHWHRGEAIFAERRCGQCHVGPLTYTSQPSFDVGLSDERGRTKFNPPSLRGVSQNARFFHDNRCESIEAVFRDEQHQLDTPLSDEDIAALARFLRSL